MPNSKSAAKRLRQSETARVANKARKTELKTIRKKLLRAIHDNEGEAAQELYRRFAKRVDQAAARGVFHKSYADRSKGRLAKHLNELKQGAA